MELGETVSKERERGVEWKSSRRQWRMKTMSHVHELKNSYYEYKTTTIDVVFLGGLLPRIFWELTVCSQ